jgi:hypothetical protein
MLQYDVDDLRSLAGLRVRVRMTDGATFTGWLRTDILSERSIAVYISSHSDEGVTLYLDQIAEIVPFDPPTLPPQ